MTYTRPMFPPVDQARRRLLTLAATGATALTVVPARAAVPTIDPVFELIEAHRKANAAHYAAIRELDRLEKTGFVDWGITEKPCDDENDAFDQLVAASATTLPGIFAKVAYLREIAESEAWMLDEREGTAVGLIESFATSIKNILVQS
jgi:hypothetical protein